MHPINPQRLKQAREQAGLSLSQVENLSGFSRRTINEMELGNLRPRMLWIVILAEMYGVSEAWLRGEETPLELTPEHLDQLATLSPANREHIINFLISIRGRE